MSPEQAAGENEAESAADLWAISVILYEAAAGDLPFMADNYNKLMRLIVDEEAPPLPTTDPLVASLGPIVSKGLAKNITQRWQTADELGEALAGWLMAHGVGEDATGARVTGRWDLNDLGLAHTSLRDSQLVRVGTRGHATPLSIAPPARSSRKSVLWALPIAAVLAATVAVVWSLTAGSDEEAAATAPLQTMGLSSLAKASSEAAMPSPQPASVVEKSRPAFTAAEAPSSTKPALRQGAPAQAPAAQPPKPKRRPQSAPPPPAPGERSAEDLGLKNPY
jgi:serine/threonine-protein kinase